MATICLAVEQWSDSHSDFDTCTAFAPDTLASEFLTVTSTSVLRLHGGRLLVLKLVGELLRLAECYLSLQASSSIVLILHRQLLLL